MDSRAPIREDTPVTLALVLVLWAGGVLAASLAGVFARLGDEELLALSGFATAFALATYRLDGEVRDVLERHGATLPAALALDVLAAIGIAGPALPHPLTLLFVIPLAAAMSAATVARLRGARRVRSARAKSPGATPAAT